MSFFGYTLLVYVHISILFYNCVCWAKYVWISVLFEPAPTKAFFLKKNPLQYKIPNVNRQSLSVSVCPRPYCIVQVWRYVFHGAVSRDYICFHTSTYLQFLKMNIKLLSSKKTLWKWHLFERILLTFKILPVSWAGRILLVC